MYKFDIPPDQASFTFTDGTEVLSTQLNGGASRYRLDILNSNPIYTVQWTLNQDEYNFLRVLYKIATISGSQPFLLDLYLDDPYELTEHTCYFVPGSLVLSSQSGTAFVVTANLEVAPVPMVQDYQDAAFMFFAFGEEYLDWLSKFDILMNVTIPAAMV